MKIIFLDIDGVLNSISGLYMRGGQPIQDIYTEHLCILKWLLDKTDAKIVISSSWRIGRTTEDLRRLLYGYGLPSKYVIDITERIYGEQRGFEIKKWLDDTDHEIESFVVLDDDNDMDAVRDNFVKTNCDYGLTYVEAMKSICILNDCEVMDVLSTI